MTAGPPVAYPRPIVVSVDTSAETTAGVNAAIELGAWEAARHHVGLHLVRGYEMPPPWVHADTDTDLDFPGRDISRQLLEHTVAGAAAEHPTLVVRGSLRPGSAAHVLVAASAAAELVVMCADARLHYGGLQAGLVSVQVVAHALTPVIVMAPTRERSRDDSQGALVVVGVDGSPGCVDAVAFAFAEAQARHGRLHAVYASDQRSRPASSTDSRPGLNRSRTAARAMLADATDILGQKFPDIPVTFDAVHAANPVRALNDAGTRADLIVVGARGYGGFPSLLLGSVSDGLVRYSRTDVAVVRAVS
jgi:nucleotide-binding universal stress UspA family protein